MICKHYFDLRLRPSSDDIPTWDRFGRILRAVHVAGVHSGTPFAIDFPRSMSEGFTLGDTLRVFVESTSGADKVCDSLDGVDWFADEVEGSRIKVVGSPKAYSALVHHSIPGGVLKPRDGFSMEAQAQRRAATKAERYARTAHLPYLKIRSSSNKVFNLRLERISATSDQMGSPNGYGVSRPSQIIALPVL